MDLFTAQDHLDSAVHSLVRQDQRFTAIVARHGLPRLRAMPLELASLLRIVTDQLISPKAGEAIWQRFAKAHAPFDPGLLAETSIAELMAVGLSTAKARTFIAAARAVSSGQLDFEALRQVPDAEVLNALQGLPGIGPWTADIALLFCFGRADAWPSGDLALQVAAQDVLGLPERPKAKPMIALAEAWRPWRGAAAHLLWSHYRSLKGLPQAAD